MIIPVRINHGEENQAIWTKGQVKKRCIPSSSRPHLQQYLLMCCEYFHALAPIGIALLRKRQAKALIRGMIDLFFHTCLGIHFVCCETSLGFGSHASYISCKQVK
jgi:hypothetical protein